MSKRLAIALVGFLLVVSGALVMVNASQTSVQEEFSLATQSVPGQGQPAYYEVPVTTRGGEVSIAVNPTNSDNVVLVHNPQSTCRPTDEYCPATARFSNDGGLSWAGSQLYYPGVVIGDPFVAFDSHRRVYYSALANNATYQDVILVFSSSDGGASFGPATEAVHDWDQVDFASNDVGRILPASEDFPKLAADTSNSAYQGNLYMTFWAQLDTNGDSTSDWFGLVFTRSTDHGVSWSRPLAISSSSPTSPPLATYGAKAYNLAAGMDGKVYIKFGNYVLRSENGGQGTTPFTAIAAIDPGLVIDMKEGGIAVHPSDPAVLWWFAAATLTGYADVNIFTSKSTDYGLTWSIPTRVNSATTDIGAIQLTPFASVSTGGRLDVTWWNIGAAAGGWVFYAYSTDGGSSYSTGLKMTDYVSIAEYAWNDYASLLSLPTKAIAGYSYRIAYGEWTVYANHITHGVVFSDDFNDQDIGDWTLVTDTVNSIILAQKDRSGTDWGLAIHKIEGNPNPAQATSKAVFLDYSQDYYLDLRFAAYYYPQNGIIIADDGRVRATLVPSGSGVALRITGANQSADRVIAVGPVYPHRLVVWFYPYRGYFHASLDGVKVASFFAFNGVPARRLSLGTDNPTTADVAGYVEYDDIVYLGTLGRRFADNFDDCNISDWTITVGTGNQVGASGAQSYSLPCSLHALKATGNSNPARAASRQVDMDYSDDYYLELRFYLPSGVNERGMVLADDGRARAWVVPTGLGTTLELLGSNATVDTAIAQGAWHHLVLLYYPSRGYYDAVLDESVVARFVGFNGAPLKKVSVGTDPVVTRKFYGEVFIDDVVYVGAPPPVEVVMSASWTQLALGQTMGLTVRAQFSGAPVPEAFVVLTSTSGVSVAPATGITGGDGTFATTVQATALGAQTVTAVVSPTSNLSPGTGTFAVNVIQAKSLVVTLTSDTTEMMSFETATIHARITDAMTGAGLIAGQITTTCLLGGIFSAVTELGGGDYTFRWTAPTVTGQTYASVRATARVGGYQDATGSVVILVDPNKTNPSNPTPLYLTAQPGSTVLHSGESTTVTVYLYTAEGYAVRGAQLQVTSKSKYVTIGPAQDRLNGVYTFVVTAKTIRSSTSATLTITASKYGYATGQTSLVLSLLP